MAEIKYSLIAVLKNGLNSVSKMISASIFPPLAEGAELIMKKIEDRIMYIEKRLMRKLTSFLILGSGIVLLVLGLVFFLIDYAGWSNAAAVFSVGITIFVLGLLLKVSKYDT